MNITILMSIWCQNIWDELILKNEINILKQKYWLQTKFRVFTYDINNIFYIDENVDYFEYFPIWIRKISNIFRNLRNFKNSILSIYYSDLVVFWWWWIIFDNEVWNFTNPLLQWLFRKMLVSFFWKKIIFWAISLDIKNEKNYFYLKKLFSKTEVFVRDENSKNLLDKLNINSQIILDPVFYDNWQIWLENYEKNFLIKKIDAQNFSILDLGNIDFTWKSVWIALRSWYIWWWNDFIEKTIIKDIIDKILTSWWKVYLIPHSFHSIDKKANDYLFLKDFLSENIFISKNMLETYEIYKNKKIDICLSMRLHSMILSQVYGINFVWIKYSSKWDLIK